MNDGKTVFAQLTFRESLRDIETCLRTVRPKLYVNDPFAVELEQTVYALDSTTIDLCLSLFPWARFRKRKAAVKLHTLLDLRGNIPSFIKITDGKRLHLKQSLYTILQILSIYVFEKEPLFQILTNYERSGLLPEPDNQLNLFK